MENRLRRGRTLDEVAFGEGRCSGISKEKIVGDGETLLFLDEGRYLFS